MRHVKKLLVTGSNGFIGSHLSELLELSYGVIMHSRLASAPSKLNHHFCLDVNGDTDWSTALQGVDAVVHLAAVAHNKSDDPNYIDNVNVKGAINLAKQAVKNGVKRFIFISSIGVLGNKTPTNRPFNESSFPKPHSQYAQSKLDAENALLMIAEETGLEVVIIRPPLVYGNDAPGNFGKLVNLVKKVPILPFALCENKRSFISIDNLSHFISVCIEHPKAKNEIFCLSDGVDISIKAFTDAIAKGMDTTLIQFPVLRFIFNLVGKLFNKQELVEQLISDLQVDSNKARKLLDWQPPFTMSDTLSQLKKK